MKKILCMVLILAMVVALGACGAPESESTETPSSASPSTGTGPASSPEASSGGDTEDTYVSLNIGFYSCSVLGTFDPNATETLACPYGQWYLLYDPLFYCDQNGEMTSDIFESWAYSDDNLELTLKLKDGIMFSNGDQLVGEDIIYSIGRAQLNHLGGTYYSAVNTGKSYVSADGLTVTLVYDYVYGPGLRKLDMFVGNKSFIEGLGEKVDWYDMANICGTGPYVCTDYVTDSNATFELKSDYWNTEKDIQTDCLNIKLYTDQTTMFIDYETGALDVCLNAGQADTLRLLRGDVAGAADTLYSNAILDIALSDESPALQDAKVREAICHGVDTGAITAAAYGILGKTAKSTLSEASAYFLDGCSYDYDPAYAKQLLADAGYSSGDITLTYVCFNDSAYSTLGEMFQAYMANIGINVDLQLLDRMNAMKAYMGGASDLQNVTNSDGDPEDEPYTELSVFYDTNGFVICNKNDAELNEYLDAGLYTTDKDTRIKSFQKAQKYIYDNFWVIPVAEWGMSVCYNTDKIVSTGLVSCFKPNLTYIQLVG